MTRQRIFNKVAKHLLEQEERSHSYSQDAERNICMYRGDGGLKCAVGCLIKDKFYTTDLEFHNTSEEIVLLALGHSQPGINIHDHMTIQLLTDLQKIHDNSVPENWRYDLTALAEEEGFRLPDVLKT